MIEKDRGKKKRRRGTGGGLHLVGGGGWLGVVEREAAREAEMGAGDGVGVLIAVKKRSGLFACLPLLRQNAVGSVFAV